MKELNIVSLEGYEVDVINSTFEKIVFKKKVYDSWSDFGNTHPSVFDEYYINELGSIDRVDGSAFDAAGLGSEQVSLCTLLYASI